MRFLQTRIPRAAFMGCLALLVMLTGLLSVGHFALADDDGVSDLSLHQRASELTREFATAIAPGSGVDELTMIEDNDSDDLLPAGNAGALLGYAEILSDDSGIVGWLMNSYTASSANITYDQLMHIIDNSSDSALLAGLFNPFYQYAGYGEVLTDMGLISTLRPGIGGLGRMAGTGIVVLVYLLANVAPLLFRGALMILITLNPFRLFETAINGTASADLGIISGVAENVGALYTTIQDFSIVLLFPALLAMTVFSALVIRKGSAMKRFARYAVRVFMLFAGLPLIGATYTGLINDLESNVAVGSEYADYLILSSYVDFENWVRYSRLAPPEGGKIMNPRLGEDEERTLSNRELILAVNGTRANNTRADALKDRYSATSDIGEILNEGGGRRDIDTRTRSHAEKSSFSQVYSILSRHMTATAFTGSDYDGEVSGQIQKIRAADQSIETEEAIVHMFSLSANDNRTWIDRVNYFSDEAVWLEAADWTDAKGLFTQGAAEDDMFIFGEYSTHIYNAGDLTYSVSNGYVSENVADVVTEPLAPIGAGSSGAVGGLSPIAMYNFLNTTFSSTGLTVYSPLRTGSDLSRDAYASVTFGGTGISSFTRWVENVTVMLSLSVLSIAYGVMMISVAIKSIPRILSGVFGTALGSIAFTTKLLISTAVLIIQVLGMIFLYSLSESILMTLLLNFNSLVDTGGSYFGSGLILDFLTSFLITVITAVLTVFMIKNMAVFREMMEEVVTNSINRVMGALDTGTGGQGLDATKMSGGRIGQDGKLTQDAKDADSGVMGLMGAAHGLEARREAMAAERGMEGRSIGEKAKARFKTAKDLANAKTTDAMKGAVGVKGKSYERELEAKNAGIQSMRYGDATALGKVTSSNFTDNDNDKDEINSNRTTSNGQAVDKNGEIVKDAHGNALDANGNQISSSSPLGMAGMRAMTGKDGALMDGDGNAYTDEMGNTFYQNKKGQLVDEKGNFVALDKDGTLQPVGAIPGHNGKPVSALKEAKKLDDMRFDTDKYKAMKNEQDSSHYGLDIDGNVVGTDGEALRMNGSSEPLSLDDQGFVTDANGNRVAASDIQGSLDERGFEVVEDEDTGEKVLQHKGDAAMKNGAVPAAEPGKGTPGSKNLTSLAKQSNKANEVAKRANERVEELKANGAPPYAIMQAQRYADKANKNANTAQQAFNQAMRSEGKASSATGRQPVTEEHVASAARHATAQKSTLDESVQKLEQMKNDGASPAMIARQSGKVEAQRKAVQESANVEQDLRTAKDAGRSYNEVSSARTRVESAERVYQKAQNAHAQAVASGQPGHVVQKREQRMNQASKVLSNAQASMSRVSEKPSGTPQQIDRATAQYDKAKANYEQATNTVDTMRKSPNKPTTREMNKALKHQAQAERQMNKAQTAKQQVLDPPGWRSKARSVPQTKAVPNQSASKSYATLTTSGVSNYSDYQTQLLKHTTDLKNSQSKLEQAEQRLKTLRASNRPPQIVKQAEKQVASLQTNVDVSKTQVKTLKDNAQGLLKNSNFQPVVASRPIRKNGQAIINQMIHMSQSQSMYDKLEFQQKNGTITEAGQKQMKTLGTRLNQMKLDLTRSGIREDSLQDHAGIVQSTKHMQQSWESFVNGKSDE
ncbi:hypothetical protein [Evansella clarkii]|uniref:hypothetical protein n=1 Tax=Evansella clarkii TaxID=79879 RepID=UPI000996E19A|nr:hypothetical protein [Evansella clarkii]